MPNTKVPIELSSTPGIIDNSTVTAITIDSAGAATFSDDVGIGVNPSYQLDVYDTAAAFAAKIKNFNGSDAGGGLWIDTRWNTAGNRPLKITSNNEGTSIFEVTGNGNVGIGTSSPATNLHIQSASEPAITLFHTGIMASQIGLDSTGSLTFGIDGSTGATERMRIDASGNLGVGAVPSAWGSNYLGLDVGSAGSFWGTRSGNTLVAMSDNSYLNGSSYIARNTGVGSKYYQNAGAHYWDTAASASAGAVQTNSTLMQLTASGDIYLGNTTSWSINGTLGNLVTGPHYTRLPTANGLYWSSSVNTSNQYIVQNNAGNGVYIAYGATSWSSTSDERLKDIIEPITDGLEKVATLRTVIGKYKTDEEEVRRPFLMAQDVFEVLPEAVDQSNPDAWGLSTHDLTPLLVSALKDAKNLIEALTARIEALEGA